MIEPVIDCPRCNGTGSTFLGRIVGRRVRCSCPAGQQIADASPSRPSSTSPSLRSLIDTFSSR